MFESFFKNKNVLITGHTGFKGAWLALWLSKLGANVSGLALEPDTNPNLFDKLNLKNTINHNICDIRDENAVKKLFSQIQPEIVFHMAAQPLVLRSYKEPKYTYEVNVLGTVNLLECLKTSSTAKIFINITTDKCYENKEWVYGYRETDPLGGYDPYSSSKACSEIVTASYRNSFFNPKDYGKTHQTAIATVRAGNVIGGGDWSENRLVPDCIKALAANEVIPIRNPRSTRPWQHVLEPLRGYLMLACKLGEDPQNYSQAWNFGPNETSIIDVENLVQKIIKFWGQGRYELDSSQHYHENILLKLDLSKSIHKLGFRPLLEIDQALELTVNWYKEFYKDDIKIQNLTSKQIDLYQQILQQEQKIH